MGMKGLCQICALINQHDINCRSAGKKQEFDGETYTIEELTENRCGPLSR